MFLVSCKSAPRKLPPYQSGEPHSGALADTPEEYEQKLVDRPEMYDRELSLPERRELLRVNWAMQKAVDEGKLRVRLLAPPIQLTGDESIDRSSTYEAVLVTDDPGINAQTNFLDLYEVRISPKPELYVVQHSTSAKSLRDADNVLAEEELARLRLDDASLKSGQAFAKNIQPLLSNHLAAASLQISNDFKLYNGQITTLNSNLFVLTSENSSNLNTLAGMVKANPTGYQTNAAYSALYKATVELTNHTGNTQRQLDLATLQLSLSETNLAELNQRSRAARDLGDVTSAYLAGIDVLQSFWTNWINSRTYYTSYSTNGDFHTNYSAVSIKFRPRSVADLKQVTIDVIRRGLPTQTNDLGKTWKQLRLSQTLEQIDDMGRQASGLLHNSSGEVDLRSRWRQLQAINSQIYIASRRLQAEETVFNADDQALVARSVSFDGTGVANLMEFMPPHFRETDELTPEKFLAVTSSLTNLLKTTESLRVSTAGTVSNLQICLDAPTNVIGRTAALVANVKAEIDGQQQKLDELSSQLGPIKWSNTNATTANFWSLAQRFPPMDTTGFTNLEAGLQNAGGQVINLQSQLQQVRSNLLANAASLDDSIQYQKQAAGQLKAFYENVTNFGTSLKGLSADIKNIKRNWPFYDSSAGDSSANDEANARLKKINESLTSAFISLGHNLDLVYTNLSRLSIGDLKARAVAVPPELTFLRGDIAQVSDLLEGRRVVQENTNFMAVHYDALTDRILLGYQAVYHLNVMHGIVTTTAFMLPDDGAAEVFGHAFADHFYAAQVTFVNPNDKPILIYGNTMRLVVRMNAADVNGRLSEEGIPERKTWWATYEPLDYDTMRRMMEGQQAHSWQKNLELVMDAALMAGGGWVAVGAANAGFSQAFGVVSAIAPKARDEINQDLARNATNFHDKGLNSIEEIPAHGTITRDVFLPKGALYGTYGFDSALADELPMPAREHRWLPFSLTANDHGKVALEPAYIFDVRREEVYVKGKRILASDPLTSTGASTTGITP